MPSGPIREASRWLSSSVSHQTSSHRDCQTPTLTKAHLKAAENSVFDYSGHLVSYRSNYVQETLLKMLVINHLLLLLLLPIVQSRKLRQLGMEDEMMTENKIDSNSLNFGATVDDMSSEESLEESLGESSEEEDRQMEYLDEEEPPSNAVDLGEDMPKRRNWFDRCGDCEGVPEDQVLCQAKNITA